MGITLQLEDALSEKLRQQASAEHTSVEEFAHRLMSTALQERIDAKYWHCQNRRRLQLIAKNLNDHLNSEEEQELEQLQFLAYDRAAPFDKILLQTVTTLRREVEQLSEETHP
jgi:hypothetical protein